MAVFRVTFFLQQAESGWSETYFSTLNTYQNVATAATVLGGLRQAMCPPAVYLQEVRVSDDLLFRDVWFDPNFQAIQGSFGGNALPPQAAIKIRMVSPPVVGTKNYSRTLDFSGVPQGQTRLGQFFSPNAAWILAFQQYALQLANTNWGLRIIDQVANPKIAVTTVAVGGVVTTAANVPNMAAGVMVRFYWPRGLRPKNALASYRVTASTALNSFTVPAAATLLPPPSFVRALIPSIINLNNGVIFYEELVGNHKRGRPFDQQLGRRRAV
jgi:hypothetical protein